MTNNFIIVTFDDRTVAIRTSSITHIERLNEEFISIYISGSNEPLLAKKESSEDQYYELLCYLENPESEEYEGIRFVL